MWPNDESLPFGDVLAFFNDQDRQKRMEDSEVHHDRAPLAGVVRELESQPTIHRFLAEIHARKSQRLRQAIGCSGANHYGEARLGKKDRQEGIARSSS